MKPVRVLMLLENNPYPQDVRVHREARTLANAGYHVYVICPSAPGQPKYEVLDGVELFRFRAPPEAGGWLGYFIEYGYSLVAMFLVSLRVFFTRGFDIVHAHNPPDMLFLIALFYKLFGKRFIYDHHDLSPQMYQARFGGPKRGLLYRVLLTLERMSCRVADRVIATNQSYKLVDMERNGVPEERITIVRNGPDLSREYGFDTSMNGAHPAGGKITLGYVGVMGHQDGVDYLLKAVHHLVYDLGRTDFCCILVGKGDAVANLKTMAEELQVTDYVSFTGWVDHSKVASYLSATDICVAPEPSNDYNDRSTMIKITEYMAASKPIVAFDLPEHRFTAHDAAVYAAANDPMEMAKQILALMDDPDQRKQMGCIGRQRIETQLAWSYQAENLLQAYASMTREVSKVVQVP